MITIARCDVVRLTLSHYVLGNTQEVVEMLKDALHLEGGSVVTARSSPSVGV